MIHVVEVMIHVADVVIHVVKVAHHVDEVVIHVVKLLHYVVDVVIHVVKVVHYVVDVVIHVVKVVHYVVDVVIHVADVVNHVAGPSNWWPPPKKIGPRRARSRTPYPWSARSPCGQRVRQRRWCRPCRYRNADAGSP